jgi:hypothetical protein
LLNRTILPTTIEIAHPVRRTTQIAAMCPICNQKMMDRNLTSIPGARVNLTAKYRRFNVIKFDLD